MIEPGAESRPFVDFRAKVEELPEGQRVKVVGKANLQLIESGVVEWEDVVTGQRVRDLREVVALKRLSVDDLIKAGVGPRTAATAYESVNTPAHELARRTRQEMIDRLTAKGLQKEDLKRALGERLAARVGIGEGPSGPGRLPVVPTTATELIASVRADYLKKAKVKADVAEATALAEANRKAMPPPPAGWEPRKQSEFRAFGSGKDMEQFGEESFGAWADSLSQQDKNAIKLYAADNYKWMNAILRGEPPAAADLPHGLSEQGARDYIARTIAPLARGKVDRDVVAYRGVRSLKAMKIDAGRLVQGQEVAVDGFLSTTLRKDKANDFAVGTVGAGPTDETRAILQINTPAGATGGYLNAAELSGYSDERELLSPPGVKLRFVRAGGVHKDVWGNETPILVFERVE